MMLAQVLRGIIFFIAVFSPLAANTEEDMLEKLDEEFDVTNNDDEPVEEETKPAFDNAVDIQEG